MVELIKNFRLQYGAEGTNQFSAINLSKEYGYKMKTKYVSIELEKIFRRKQFWIITVFLLAVVFLNFYISCYREFGQNLSEIPSAYWVVVIDNKIRVIGNEVFTSFLFPLAVSIIASDLYIEEKLDGINNFLFTRMSKKTIFASKVVAISLVTFFVTFLCILISYFLARSAFPLQGNDTSQTPFLELMEPDKRQVLGGIKEQYPYLNVIIYGIQWGITAASASVFAFAISFLPRTNRYIVLFSPMIFYMAWSIVGPLIGKILCMFHLGNAMEADLLTMNPYGNVWTIILYFVIQIALSTILIWRGIRSGDEILA